MFARQSVDSPWPVQTPLPAASSSSSRPTTRRRRLVVERHAGPAAFVERATIANQSQIDQAKEQCFNSDFSVFSCWPTENTSLFQNEGTQFVWNSRHPDFTQFNLVDIALKRADTGDIVMQALNQTNPTTGAGFLPVIADDAWWESSGASWPGTDVPFPLNFIIVPSGSGFNYLPPQSTFTAIQTTFANSVLSAMSSSSAAAAASSSSVAASLSSLSLLSSLSSASVAASVSASESDIVTTISGVATTISAGHGATGLQDGSSTSSSFPHWAIAVIVILGFFALAAFIALLFLIFQRIRRRNDVSRRGSMGSQSPMMENAARNDAAYPTSPAVGAPPGSTGLATGAGLGAGAAAAAGGSVLGGDGASTHSDALISGADAAVITEAFRKALRNPDFAGRPVEEGESPEAGAQQEESPELLNRELAEEGRDMRNVGSARTPRVETLSEGGDAATARDSLV